MKTKYLYYTALGLLTIVVIDGTINGFTPITTFGSITSALMLTELTRRKAYKE